MATSLTTMRSLTLLVLASLQGCRAEDQGSLDQAALLAAMKEINRGMQGLGDTTQEGLRLHKENNNALKDLHSLPDMMMQVKEQVNQWNEKFEYVIRENAVLHRVDALTQENTNLKTQLANQNQTVEQLKTALQEKETQIRTLQREIEMESNVTQENSLQVNTSNDQQQMAACMALEGEPQHLQEIKEVVQEFSNSSDWETLKRGLEAVLDNSSEAYSQLQAGTVWNVGRYAHTELASLLLCSGLPVDTRDIDGGNMLQGAAAGGHLKLVKLLLDFGADVNAKNNYNWTPLMGAAYNGDLEVVQWLVQAGAETIARNQYGRNALEIARLEDNRTVLQYLKQLPH